MQKRVLGGLLVCVVLWVAPGPASVSHNEALSLVSSLAVREGTPSSSKLKKRSPAFSGGKDDGREGEVREPKNQGTMSLDNVERLSEPEAPGLTLSQLRGEPYHLAHTPRVDPIYSPEKSIPQERFNEASVLEHLSLTAIDQNAGPRYRKALDSHLQIFDDLRVAKKVYESAAFHQALEGFDYSIERDVGMGWKSMALLEAEKARIWVTLALTSAGKEKAFRTESFATGGIVEGTEEFIQQVPVAIIIPNGFIVQLPAREICRRIPEGVTLVEYAVLKDRLFLWVLNQEGLRFFEKPVPRLVLEKKVSRLRILRNGHGDWAQLSSDLYDVLLNPWIAEVEKDELLVFVPDKSLHSICFSCLMNPDTGRYLVQDQETALAVSATAYLEGLEDRRKAGHSKRTPILIIGDPAFERNLFRRMPRLPGADSEAKVIADFYPQAALLLGKEAHKRNFLSLSRRSRRIHFGVHSIMDLRDPMRSMLLLAPSGSDLGALYAEEICEMRLDNTDLVVLAACSTTGQLSLGNELGMGLARAFQAAGVPIVVASLWDIEDQASAKLFREFYRQLRAGAEPASALRAAQLNLLENGDAFERTPEAWAAFQVIGSS
ncbi:MAG TPA: CHAT domain-containing protein, partial [Thermoanaerobaculia bacterium]|nr:CHAT domain-containing protein [Thermoanaerobaculia bacterium]